MAQQTDADDVTETPTGLPNYSGPHAAADAAASAIGEKYSSLVVEHSPGHVVILADGLLGHWIVEDLQDLGYKLNAANMDKGALYFEVA